jgi:hypothetical protein
MWREWSSELIYAGSRWTLGLTRRPRSRASRCFAGERRELKEPRGPTALATAGPGRSRGLTGTRVKLYNTATTIVQPGL